MPPALEVNFAAPTRSLGRGLALALIGAAACVAVMVAHLRLGSALEQVDLELRAAVRKSSAVEAPAITDPAKSRALLVRIGGANRILNALEHPWFGLLDAIESARAEGIALLAIDADAATGGVRITAEAETLDELSRYLDRLGANHALRDMRLLQHERREQTERAAIRFVVAAQWSGKS